MESSNQDSAAAATRASNYRYKILKEIGKGSFGQVYKAFDHKNHQNVALKIVKNVKQCEKCVKNVEQCEKCVKNMKQFEKQAETEIKILEQLKDLDKNSSQNIIKILDSFKFRNHVCIIFELLWMNLYEYMRRNKSHGFPPQIVWRFGVSLVWCLNTLWKNKIIHCDLKPGNIMIIRQGGSDLKIKVIDFGLSCYEHSPVYTHIQTRYYRAPEVILRAKYGMPIDMWSLGCILCELLTGQPLFRGCDEGDMLACMMEVLRMPDDEGLIHQSKEAKKHISSQGCPRYCTEKSSTDGGQPRQGKYRGPPGSRKLQTVLKTENKRFLDFITRCLTWEPEARMNPGTALINPWISPPSPAKMCTW